MTFLHDDRCAICRRGRRLRRRAMIERLIPWICILGIIVTMAVAEWAQHP